MDKTDAVCAMLGSTINTNECCTMVDKPARARFREEEGLPGVTLPVPSVTLGVTCCRRIWLPVPWPIVGLQTPLTVVGL